MKFLKVLTIRTALGCLVLATGAMVLVPGASLAASGKVRVLKTTPFAKNAPVPEKVKEQCQLQEKLPMYLSQASDKVELVESLGRSGRTLELEIVEVHAPSAGIMSGPKWMDVRGVLREHGRKVASFTDHRTSMGGSAWFKGTCAIAARSAQAIGSDIAAWLNDPQDGAILGR